MSLATVAELRSTLGVGTLYPDATLQEVCDAADAVLLPMLWANNEYAYSQSNVGTTGTLYFKDNVLETYYLGQTVTVSNAGVYFDGVRTITGLSNYSISMATTHLVSRGHSPINPYATVTAESYIDFTLDAAVQNAGLMIAVEIWQARTATLSGSNLADFQPSPYRMSAQLLAKVRGLISHALSPNSMVG